MGRRKIHDDEQLSLLPILDRTIRDWRVATGSDQVKAHSDGSSKPIDESLEEVLHIGGKRMFTTYRKSEEHRFGTKVFQRP